MKAIVMSAPGGPEVLQLADVPEPRLVRDVDMLVRVKAAGINPVDAKMRSTPSAYPVPLSNILGCDGAGVVEAVGTAVRDFQPGDEVYFCQCGVGDRNGTYAQYMLVDHRGAAKKPANLSFAEAAAAPLVLITAWESLYDRTQLATARRILIHAGAGGVGHVAIQLASISGVAVATTVGSREKAEFASALGASRVIFYRDDDFVTAVLAWTGGQGVDLALDTVGGKTLAATFAAVRHYGDVVTLLQPGPEIDWSVPRMRNQRLCLEIMLTPIFYDLSDALKHQGEILRLCAELIELKRLRIHVDTTFPLADAAKAQELLASGRTKGKIALIVD